MKIKLEKGEIDHLFGSMPTFDVIIDNLKKYESISTFCRNIKTYWEILFDNARFGFNNSKKFRA